MTKNFNKFADGKNKKFYLVEGEGRASSILVASWGREGLI
jgi:predicted DNA-binding WGR domain protein